MVEVPLTFLNNAREPRVLIERVQVDNWDHVTQNGIIGCMQIWSGYESVMGRRAGRSEWARNKF